MDDQTSIGRLSARATLESVENAHDNELREEQRQLLLLMAQGFPDTTIARRLSLGPRTLARRISDLYVALGVETRFQAGAAAERLGLLTPVRRVAPHRHLTLTAGTAQQKVS